MEHQESVSSDNSRNDATPVDHAIPSSQTTDYSGESYDEQLVKRSKNVHFDVESWYPIIQEQTFNTEFLPISPSLAQAFVHFYQTRYMSKTSLTLNDIQHIQSIEGQLKQEIFQSDKFQKHGAFIRLSARSPKDGKPLDLEKPRQFYQQKLSDLQTAYPDEYQTLRGKANMQTIALYHAQFHSLKVTDEAQALNLILSSERIYHDLIEILDCQQVREHRVDNTHQRETFDWNNHLIIRRWNESLDPAMEFRCFVHQSKLTAISQYNFHCKYHRLQSSGTVQRMRTTIINYWQEKIRPLFGAHLDKYSNYVIDIGLIDNKATNEYTCIVIELNPFERTTNPSLFDWNKDSDQLRGQGVDVEMRVQADYYPFIEDYIDFLLEINECNEEVQSITDHPGKKPYGIFMEQIKTQLC